MKITRNVEVPKVVGSRPVRSPYIEELHKFLDSDDCSMCITCDTDKEATNCASTIRQNIKKHELPCKSFKRGLDIYVTKNNLDYKKVVE